VNKLKKISVREIMILSPQLDIVFYFKSKKKCADRESRTLPFTELMDKDSVQLNPQKSFRWSLVDLPRFQAAFEISIS